MSVTVVEGVEIPDRLIAEEAQHHPGADIGEARAAAGHALAVKALLLHRARELSLDPHPETDEQGREETREEALVRAVLDAEVTHRQAEDAECRRVYDSRRDRLRTADLYEASHVLLEPVADHPDAWSTARQTAVWALDLLRDGLVRFEELARTLSDCPSAEVGGSLGQLFKGELAPEVEVALDALAPGEVAKEPVRSRFGWHLLRLDRRIAGAPIPFEACRERIRLELEARAWTAAASRYVAVLAEEARAQGVAIRLDADGGVARASLSLGDFLDGARADRLEPWLDKVDPALAARVREAAAKTAEPVPEFVRTAAAEFVQGADDEAWTRLISAARDADDPALACLAALLRARLTPKRRAITLIRTT